MAGLAAGAEDFARLSRRLKETGQTGLRRSLYQAISDAAKPLTREISNEGHLRPYMPNRYAGTLSDDLSVSISRRAGSDPGVSIRARGRVRNRHVTRINAGILTHPLFGDRERWYLQLRGMRAGFFSDPADKSGPDIREAILAAMHEAARYVETGV